MHEEKKKQIKDPFTAGSVTKKRCNWKESGLSSHPLNSLMGKSYKLTNNAQILSLAYACAAFERVNRIEKESKWREGTEFEYIFIMGRI